MKKLYVALICSTVSFSAISSFGVLEENLTPSQLSLSRVHSYQNIIKPKPSGELSIITHKNEVISALEKIDINHPLQIPYLGKDATASASNPVVTKVLRAALKKSDRVFTAEVVNEISFSSTPLVPGTAVVVIDASYHGQTVGIYVQQSTGPYKTIIGALGAFNFLSNPVKIDVRYHHHYADEYSSLGVCHKTGDAIRDYLVDHDLTHKINLWNKDQITFSHTYLLQSTITSVVATYHQQTAWILVQLVSA